MEDIIQILAEELKRPPQHIQNVVALLDEGCGVTPAEMRAKLNEAGIEGRYLWKPMHLQPVFAGCPFVSVSDAPVGDDLFARGVCLPSDTKMSMDDVDRVCEAIRGMF